MRLYVILATDSQYDRTVLDFGRFGLFEPSSHGVQGYQGEPKHG